MPELKIVDKKSDFDLPGQANNNFPFWVRPAILSLSTFIILALLFSLLIFQRYEIQKESKNREAMEIVNGAKEKLQETLTHGLSATKTLSFFIGSDGEIKDFDSIAAQILETRNDIDAIQLEPGGVIRLVYPLKDNESIIGYDILNDTTRIKEAYKAIEKKEMFFAGPLELKQGGMGVVGRLPVFRNNKFWGFSAVVINMSTLFKAAQIDSTHNSGFHFQLSKINPDSKKEDYFLPFYKGPEKGQTVSVNVPDGEWKLSVIRLEKHNGFGDIELLTLLGFLLSITAAVLAFRIALRPRMLDKLVKEQTINLQKSENKYRSLIEQASDGIVFTNMEGIILEVNNSIQRMVGFNSALMIGHHIKEFIPETDINEIQQWLDELMMGKSLSYERILLKKDGIVLDVEISTKLLSDDRYQYIIRDITERKKADLALQQSEETYRVLVENAPEALVVFDVMKQIFIIVSETATKLFGMPEEELLKLGPVALSPEYQPDGRLSSEGIIGNIQKSINGEKPVFEWTHCDKAGNLIPCEVWLVRLPSENEILIRGSIIDITDRKKAEESLVEKEKRLQQVLSSSIDNFYVVDVNYTVILINKVAERNLEIAWGKPVKQGTNLLDIIPEHGEEPIRENFTKAFSGELFEYELNLTHPDLPTWVMVRFTPVYDESEKIIGVSVVAKDISERKKAEELLQKSYEDIRQLAGNLQSIREDERTNIAREIHDELGQQLTGLKMDLHWLTKKINSTDIEINNKFIQNIELINLTIASVRKISTNLRPSILDDLGLIAALEWQGEEFEKRSGTQVKFINKAGDITVKPEITTAVFRIYQELLTNIARHANAGLVTAVLQKENDKLLFKLTDNGSGFNLSSISSKKTLGLLGIRERTLLLGGTYEFKSNPGEGSETIISIPLA